MRDLRKATALDRLGWLLPWLNDQTNPYAADGAVIARWEASGRRALRQFLVGFDGAEQVGCVEVLRRPKNLPRFIRRDVEREAVMDPDALQRLQEELKILLETGFGGPPGALPMPSLRFGIRSTRAVQKRSALTKSERRAYDAPGAYVLQVGGTTHDVVLFLVAHLLTGPDMAGAIARCPAPAPYNRKRRCDRFFVRKGKGHPRDHCSDACRVRRNEEQKAKQRSTR